MALDLPRISTQFRMFSIVESDSISVYALLYLILSERIWQTSDEPKVRLCVGVPNDCLLALLNGLFMVPN